MTSQPNARITNLVFEGCGVLGISYLGVLDYLAKNNLLQNVVRVAGTSAGAITACITSLNLSFESIKDIADTLNYEKIPQQLSNPKLKIISKTVKDEISKLFGDIDSVYRLIHNYGWYSSDYFYKWIKTQIALHFDIEKKAPPYTFADFKNTIIHKNKRPFLDLYIIGTNLSYKTSAVFSYETTPDMEVAEAVRISMSIPLFFESINLTPTVPHSIVSYSTSSSDIFCDGGVMRNYPINIFDNIKFRDELIYGINFRTLGAKIKHRTNLSPINNLLDYIRNLNESFMSVQQDIYTNSPSDRARSIEIDTGSVSPINFNIKTGDNIYQFLYRQGFKAAKNYFEET